MGSKKASKKPIKKINKKTSKKTSIKKTKPVKGTRKIKKTSKTSKTSSKKKKKSSKNKVEDNIEDSDEYMRKIIFSTEDDTNKINEQQPNSIPTYTPTFNPQMTGHQQMTGHPMIQAPTLTPTDYNPNLYQNMAPAMDYKYFNGNVNSLPNYYNQMNTGPMNSVAGPMSPIAGPMSPIAGPMSQYAGPMSPIAGPMSQYAGPMSPIARPMSQVPINSSYPIDINSLPNYIN